MAYGSNMGDNQLFREDFLSDAAVEANGGTIVGTPTINHGLTSASGAVYFDPRKVDYFLLNGGTMNISITPNTSSSASFQRIVAYGDGTGYGLSFGYIASTDKFYGILDNGSVYYPYWDSPVGQNTRHELTVVFDGSSHPTCYVNGALQSEQRSTSAPPNTAPNIYYGGRTGAADPFNGTIHDVSYYKDQWTAQEALDAYNKDTYSSIDASKMNVWMNLADQYVFAAGTTKTTNLGTENDPIVSSVLGLPSQITPHGFKFTPGQGQIITFDNPIVTTGDFTVGGLVRLSGLGTGNTSRIFDNFRMFVFTDTDNKISVTSNSAANRLSTGTNAFALKSLFSLIVSRKSDGTACIYINGKLAATGDSGTPSTTGYQGFHFANIATLSRTIDGNMYNGFLMKDKLLTPRQVRWMDQRMRKTLNV